MNSILIGVGTSRHSEDAIAFARRVAYCSSGRVIVACAFPADEGMRRIDEHQRRAMQRDAEHAAGRMSLLLEGVDGGRIRTCAVAAPSRTRALHDLATREEAAIVVVGASRPRQLGQVLPHGIGARLLHYAPCAVAVVPDGYRARRDEPIERIGVAYDGSSESRAALAAAVAAVRALDAELEVITVLSAQILATATMMGGPGYISADEDFGRKARKDLDAIVAGLPSDVIAEGTILDGRPAHQLSLRSRRLDVLLVGSRGYSPLHAAVARGVSGRVIRDAQCPVVAVPRGVDAPIAILSGARRGR
jgi:nucleotide-binding universal stress UspA family protein